ncbi:hypothetical protein SPRG_13979 [Saprolegnia parasitica CBS 223.65]|uniref:Uncharacterized protein n=1 Tax=Saprolegnia parasitica (strain CBS 223.65) TaxID=695850 RepID=A0A067BPH4_SAPPC|nr:hypothetical protein SPRG_13979 [Saprolegnia parasitica CBS 223.65]KDO20153.1 hypothetical protein SPRG_13979 [Saprolegnia parasitica CBS 223.65]|eukprot:XP_012209147.1 hypothetical protein SPRG_13979 [Saprolegnia parasitica CBS 223.65]
MPTLPTWLSFSKKRTPSNSALDPSVEYRCYDDAVLPSPTLESPKRDRSESISSDTTTANTEDLEPRSSPKPPISTNNVYQRCPPSPIRFATKHVAYNKRSRPVSSPIALTGHARWQPPMSPIQKHVA